MEGKAGLGASSNQIHTTNYEKVELEMNKDIIIEALEMYIEKKEKQVDFLEGSIKRQESGDFGKTDADNIRNIQEKMAKHQYKLLEAEEELKQLKGGN